MTISSHRQVCYRRAAPRGHQGPSEPVRRYLALMFVLANIGRTTGLGQASCQGGRRGDSHVGTSTRSDFDRGLRPARRCAAFGPGRCRGERGSDRRLGACDQSPHLQLLGAPKGRSFRRPDRARLLGRRQLLLAHHDQRRSASHPGRLGGERHLERRGRAPALRG